MAMQMTSQISASLGTPADGVPPPLLPHLHLVSTYRFPNISVVPLEKIVDFLHQAVRIARDLAPMHWVFLDAPVDGTMMLVWQPLAQLGAHFASDGYVWADPEIPQRREVGPYTVEIYEHKSGYRLMQEPITLHARQRFRLLNTRNSTGPYTPDESLWMVHYTRSEPANQIPVQNIRISPQIQNSLSFRSHLLNQGRLVRNDFMLYDKQKWPRVSLPGANFNQTAATYQQNVFSRMPNQRPGYYQPPGPPMSGPPAKRQQTAAAHTIANKPAPPMMPTRDPALAEEEDVQYGDAFDLITPREISLARYKQHNEWAEEIFGSHYPTSSLVPADLGLGRKGELELLTKRFFQVPSAYVEKTSDGDLANDVLVIKDDNESEVKAEPGLKKNEKLDEFRELAEKMIVNMNAEIEEMKKQHKKELEEFKSVGIYTLAEEQLRLPIKDVSEPGYGIVKRDAVKGSEGTLIERLEKLDREIIGMVEKQTGLKHKVVQAGARLVSGHLPEEEDIKMTDEQVIGDVDRMDEDVKDDAPVEMFGNAAIPKDQSRSPNPPMDSVPATSAPPDSALPVSVPTDSAPTNPISTEPISASTVAQPQVETTPATTQSPPSQSAPGDNDVQMTGMSNNPPEASGGDWVMVETPSQPAGGAAPIRTNPPSSVPTPTPAHISQPPTSMSTPVHTVASSANTPAGLSASGDFGDINTAGDALAAYGEQHADDNVDSHGDIGAFEHPSGFESMFGGSGNNDGNSNGNGNENGDNNNNGSGNEHEHAAPSN